MPPKPKEINPASLNPIPPGYAWGKAPDGRQYIVPQMLLPDIRMAFAGHAAKIHDQIGSKKPKLSQHESILQADMGGGLFKYPSDPLPSEQERLAIHAEVKALQDHLGISYKDASHRLYMAEVAKLAIANKEAKAWKNLAAAMKNSLKELEVEMDEGKKSENENNDRNEGR